MLSAQCDELRERAATLRQGRWSDGSDDARLMEDSAETILSLRDRAQDLQAENAKLRELVQKLYANLRNRETILELMRMPPSEAAKDEVIAIIDKCSELGIEVK
jgi:hypothetical protein